MPCVLTCHQHTKICKEYCYEIKVEDMLKKKGDISQVSAKHRMNLFVTLQDSFEEKGITELSHHRLSHKINIVRIHASGDFYSKKYFEKWLRIALTLKLRRKNILFFAYTKSINIIYSLYNHQRLYDIYNEVSKKEQNNLKIKKNGFRRFWIKFNCKYYG